MDDLEKAKRKVIEKRILMKYARWAEFVDPWTVKGWVKTRFGNIYELIVVMGSDYPIKGPDLLVNTPLPLRVKGSGQPIRDLGTSHAFHTLGSGPNDQLKICFTSQWDSSMTCASVLIKGDLWVNAYEIYLATGIAICEILRRKSLQQIMSRHDRESFKS